VPAPPNPLVARLERLYTGVVSDCLDAVGVRSNVLSPGIRPIYAEARVAGIAATAESAEVDGVPDDPVEGYSGILGAVDGLHPDEVLVVSHCPGSLWGELMATASRYRGARGAILDGYTRDVPQLIEMAFPTFCAGMSPADSLGRVEIAATGVLIVCGGVAVNPGDLMLGDYDGVVCVPRAVAEEVITRAEEKVAGEDTVRARLAEGMSATEAFRTYGVI
jgi:4-hydroxy-4-methyl-2-oxoglutarate aldolase